MENFREDEATQFASLKEKLLPGKESRRSKDQGHIKDTGWTEEKTAKTDDFPV